MKKPNWAKGNTLQFHHVLKCKMWHYVVHSQLRSWRNILLIYDTNRIQTLSLCKIIEVYYLSLHHQKYFTAMGNMNSWYHSIVLQPHSQCDFWLFLHHQINCEQRTFVKYLKVPSVIILKEFMQAYFIQLQNTSVRKSNGHGA